MKDLYFINLLSLRLGIKKVKDGVWNSRCMLCGDSKKSKTKKRLFFLMKEGSIIVYCHNCGYSSSLKNFIEFQCPDLADEYALYGFKPKKQVQNISQKLNEVLDAPKRTFIQNSEFFEVTLGIDELKKNHPARKYVQNRQIPFGKVRYCADFLALHKKLLKEPINVPAVPVLLIPFYQKNNRIEIFQARFFDPKMAPKYLTIKLNPDAEKIYNKDFVDYNELVWILEGPIDSMFVPNAIAMAGSDASPSIKGEYCWVFDNEPGNSEIVNKMIKRIDNGDKIVIWKKEDTFKDINEGIMQKKIDIDLVYVILRERITEGLFAKLKLTEWRK